MATRARAALLLPTAEDANTRVTFPWVSASPEQLPSATITLNSEDRAIYFIGSIRGNGRAEAPGGAQELETSTGAQNLANVIACLPMCVALTSTNNPADSTLPACCVDHRHPTVAC